MPYANEGSIMNQNNPVTKYFDDYCENKVMHPLLIGAVKYVGPNPVYYCFQMSSRMDYANNPIETIGYELLKPYQNVKYNYYEKSTKVVHCSNIHILSKERMEQCNMMGYLTPGTNKTLRSIATRHLFFQDQGFAPADIATDDFFSLIGVTKEELRQSEDYKYYAAYASNQAFEEAVQERRNEAKRITRIYLDVVREYMSDFKEKTSGMKR